MKRLVFYSLLILLLSGCGTFVRYREIRPQVSAGEKVKQVEIKNPTAIFRVGEKLTYHIYWHRIPVGLATAQVKEIVSLNGRECYHLIGTARSNKILRLIFKVDDRIESFMDKETLLSIKHIAKRREGGYRAHIILDYDWENRRVHFQNLVDGSKKEFPLPERAEDEFSAFYYFRQLELSKDKPSVFYVNQAEKTWKVEVAITSFGRMNLPPLGFFDAFMLEPVPLLNGKPLNKGRAWVWLSNDERRLPLMLRMRVNIPFLGIVLAVLRKIE